jgi:hypothetical protein
VSSLYKRATPPQARILRIVEGAVMNAAHAHPGAVVDRRLARSVAKRAAGTLTAQWADVLADSGPSECGDGSPLSSHHRRLSDTQKATGREASQVARRFPLRLLIREISRQIRPLKHAGDTERAAAFVDVLKLIHAIKMGRTTGETLGRKP